MSWDNPNDDIMRSLLAEAKTIAVVGCSPNPGRISHQIATGGGLTCVMDRCIAVMQRLFLHD